MDQSLRALLALPESQRAGSLKMHFHSVLTRSSAVISLQLSTRHRNFSSWLSAPGTIKLLKMILRLTKIGTAPSNAMSCRLPLAHAKAITYSAG